MTHLGMTSSSIVKESREKKWFGLNQLPEKVTPKWLIFLSQFWQPMPIMIWNAVIIQVTIANYLDMWILIFIQLANGSIGFYETVKAGDAVPTLKASLKPSAKVFRHGKWQTINAIYVVPGDTVSLASGSAIPADCRVNHGAIDVDQAALTATTTLDLGSKEMSAEGAIVSRLAAIEDLSELAILCSDKTGTLTMKKMVIQEETPVYAEGETRYSPWTIWNSSLMLLLIQLWKEQEELVKIQRLEIGLRCMCHVIQPNVRNAPYRSICFRQVLSNQGQDFCRFHTKWWNLGKDWSFFFFFERL